MEYRTAKSIAFVDGTIDHVRMTGFLLRVFLLAMLLASSWSPSSAFAQSTNLDVDVMRDRESADSELGRAQWKRTRARIGVSFSVLALPISAGLLAAGVIFGVSDRNSADDVDDIGEAQLGHRSAQSTHRYAHLGSRAQLRLVEALEPSSPPHVNHTSTGKG